MKFKKYIPKFHKIQKPGIIFRFFLLLCIPIIVVTIFVAGCNTYYTEHFRSAILSVYSDDMNKFLKSVEDEFINTRDDTSLLLAIEPISTLSYTNQSIDMVSLDEVLKVQSALSSFIKRMDYVANITIVNRSGKFVISTNGIYGIEQYFNNVYTYQQYSADYWTNYRAQSGRAKILPPSDAIYSNLSSYATVIPVVIPVDGAINNSLIIFNINANMIYDKLSAFKFTENSKLIMMNNSTGETIANQNENTVHIDFDNATQLYQTNYYSVSELKINGSQYLIMQSQERYGYFGYTYIVAIPYSDIESSTYQVAMQILLTSIVLILLLLIYAYFASLRLSKPWKFLAGKLSINTEGKYDGNVISSVNGAITTLIDKNTNLMHSLAVTLPRSQQKYLVDILNNPDASPDSEMNSLIFEYEYFVSVAINISPKQDPTSAPIVLNSQLYSEIYKAIESVFAAKFLTFSLPSTNNTLYLILNVENDSCTDTLHERTEEITTLFAADIEYIDVFMGTGNIYKGIDGLRISHQEALSGIFHDMNTNRVQITDSHALNEYSFGVSNENILINYILTGHTDEAAAFIKNAFASCEKKSPENRAKVYAGIFNSLFKVIKIKKVRVSDFERKDEENILNDIMLHSDGHILNHLLRITRDLTNLETPSGKAKLAEIADYIKNHYNEDLYLDSLAQMFNMSSKYLSKALKQHLDISFKAYLAQLRITEAEKLLKDDSLSINDICKATGFTSHSSFFRAFKQQNGISPSEFRSLYYKRKK